MAWGGEKGLGEEETAPAGCCSPAPCSGQPCPAPPSACTGNSAPAAPVPRSGCSQTQQEEPQAGLKHRSPRCCGQQEGPLSWWVTETGHAASSCSTHGHSRGTSSTGPQGCFPKASPLRGAHPQRARQRTQDGHSPPQLQAPRILPCRNVILSPKHNLSTTG